MLSSHLIPWAPVALAFTVSMVAFGPSVEMFVGYFLGVLFSTAIVATSKDAMTTEPASSRNEHPS